jgi:hypothetical protein
MDREEHLARCKRRALEYVERGELADAFASMGSDMEQHPETKGCNPYLTALGLMYATNHDVSGMVRWIEGFR